MSQRGAVDCILPLQVSYAPHPAMAYSSLMQQFQEQVSLILDNYVVVSNQGIADEGRPAEWSDMQWWGMFQALVRQPLWQRKLYNCQSFT